MKLLTIIALSFTLSLALATADTSAELPALSDFKFPADHKAVEINPTGHETILEEGPEEESEANAVGQPESIPGEKTSSHEIDNDDDAASLADDQSLDASTKDLDLASEATDKPTESDDAAPVVAHFKKRCNTKCRLGKGYCPRYCKYRKCLLRFTVLRRIKYRVRVCRLIKIRIRYRIKVRYCKRVYKWGKWVCVYKFKYVYRYRIKFVKRCKYVIRYRIVKKFIFKRGFKCLY